MPGGLKNLFAHLPEERFRRLRFKQSTSNYSLHLHEDAIQIFPPMPFKPSPIRQKIYQHHRGIYDAESIQDRLWHELILCVKCSGAVSISHHH